MNDIVTDKLSQGEAYEVTRVIKEEKVETKQVKEIKETTTTNQVDYQMV